MTPERWQQVKRIFQEALEQPAESRSGFLEKACLGDGQLRASVEALLSSGTVPDDFLDSEKDDIATIVGEALLAEDTVIGQTIGSYRIDRVIGEGGMGMVYLGVRDDEEFQQKVAIKLIKRGMDTRVLLRRFRHERQTLAGLQHPNIARLYDGGTTDDGLPYFIMEYVDGQPITDYCDSNKLTIKERLRLFRKVCAAVSHAHQNLTIHRDLKPGNILVTASGEPKLLDFGIAKVLEIEPSGLPATQATAGVRFVTPEYSSPEQFRGDNVSTASDVYSLGVLLYALLTGQRPYRFEGVSLLAIEKTFSTADPLAPSMTLKNPVATTDSDSSVPPDLQAISTARNTSPEKLRRNLQGDLDNILVKSVQIDPARRYATVDQLTDDLARFQQGLPVSARKDTLGYRAKKFIKRHKLSLAAAIVVFLSLIAGIVGISWQAAIAREEATKSQQTLEFVKQTLAAANPLESGKELTVEQLLDGAIERIPQELSALPEIEGDIRAILGEAYQNLGNYDKASEILTENLLLQQRLHGPQHSQVANAHRLLAVVEQYRGNLPRADSLYRRAISIYKTVGDVSSGDYGIALNDFGTMLLDKAEYDSAAAIFRQSLEIVENVYGHNHIQAGSILNNLAFALDDLGKFEEAAGYYDRALTVFRTAFGNEHPEIANTLNNLAFVKLNVGDTLGSLQLHEQALAMWRQALGNDHPDIGINLHNVAAVNFYLRNYSIAEAKEKEVIEIFKKNFPEDHPYLGSSYFLMGRILNAQKRYKTAEPYLKDALDIRSSKLTEGHPLIGGACLELAICYYYQNRFNEAEPLLLQASQLFQENQEEQNLAKAKTLLAELFRKQGKMVSGER